MFSRTRSGCEVWLRAISQQKAEVLGADCSSRVRSSFLLSAVWCQRPTLGRKSNAVRLKSSQCPLCILTHFCLSSFICRRCLECVCIQDLGVGSPSEPCWSLEVWRRVRRWCSPFLQIVCLPEREGYSCWRLLTLTGRYLAWTTQGRMYIHTKSTSWREPRAFNWKIT